MLKFNNNHIFTGYLKQLLASFNLPTYKVYKKEYLDYLTEHGEEDPRIISSEVKEGDIYPDHVLYVNYIKNNRIQRYYDGKWHPTTLHYHYNKKEPNQTRSLRVKDGIYTADTHEYLGEYLRFQRDYNNYDLMPLYNCFSDRVCPLLQTTFDVPTYVAGPSDTHNYGTKTITIDSTDPNYKIYMLPVKLFEKYTIAISSQNVEVFCGFYGAYYDERDKLKIIPSITYVNYSSLQFNQPVLYDRLSVENITAGEIRAAELAQIERNLKMFIKVPITCDSSIVVLEGDYTQYNKALFAPTQIWNETSEGVDFVGNDGYKFTEYFWDDPYLRRLIGVTDATRLKQTAVVGEDALKQRTTQQITTIIDHVPSNENEFEVPYEQEDINCALLPFISAYVGDTNEINLTRLESSDLLDENYTYSFSGLDFKFIFTGEIIITPADGKNPFVKYYLRDSDADFYYNYHCDKEGAYQPKLYLEDADKIIEARYSITITADLPERYGATDYIVLKREDENSPFKFFYNNEELPFALTTVEQLIYKKEPDTVITKVDPLTGKPVFHEVQTENGIEFVGETEVLPGEPADFNSRTYKFPVVPRGEDAAAVLETAEGISSTEEVLVNRPGQLANGYVAFCGQPSNAINGEIVPAEPGELFNYELNTKIYTSSTELSNDVFPEVSINPPSGIAQTTSWKLQLTSLDSYIALQINSAGQIIIYCDGVPVDPYGTPIDEENAAPLTLGLYNQLTGKLLQTVEVPRLLEGTPVVFDVDTGGSYLIKECLVSDTVQEETEEQRDTTVELRDRQTVNIYYIEVINNVIVKDTWKSDCNCFVTNFETVGYASATDENGHVIYNKETGDPEIIEVHYPDVAERKFVPITTLQLLRYNTGISYPFADRLIEYLLGNTISQVDEIADNVKRVQKILANNGNLFPINGAWDGKIRNILYDYMIHGHPTGEKFPANVNHDILGYVDKDVEKLYTSWGRAVCFDENGNRIHEVDGQGNWRKITVNKKLAAKDSGLLKDKVGSGRLLLVDDTTDEYLYQTKCVPTGTILNADIYEDEDEA